MWFFILLSFIVGYALFKNELHRAYAHAALWVFVIYGALCFLAALPGTIGGTVVGLTLVGTALWGIWYVFFRPHPPHTKHD